MSRISMPMQTGHRGRAPSRAFERSGAERVLLVSALFLLGGCHGKDETTLVPPPPGLTVDTPPAMRQHPLEPDAGLAVDAGEAVPPALASDAGVVQAADASTPDAGPPVPIAPPLPAPLCARLDAEASVAAMILFDRVIDFVSAQQTACETSRLLAGAGEETLFPWIEYLTAYSDHLLGCTDPLELEGGLDVFALTNTAVSTVGVPTLRIGVDDSERLIQQYLDALNTSLAFSAGERAAFEAYLRWQAAKVVDAEVSGALSSCGAGP